MITDNKFYKIIFSDAPPDEKKAAVTGTLFFNSGNPGRCCG